MILKDIIEEAIKKWETILGMFEIEADIKEIRDTCFELCAFCDDAVEAGAPDVSIDGEACRYECQIDKSICGNKDSLLKELEEAFRMEDEGVCYSIVVDIVNKLKDMR